MNVNTKIKNLMETYENEQLYSDIYQVYKVLDEITEETNQNGINIRDVSITINNNHQVPDEDDTSSKSINPMKKKQWSQYIRERGGYTCARCGKLDEQYSQAHHIFPIARYPDLAYDKGNGIVLCQHCHSEYHRDYLGRESPYTLLYFLQIVEEE